MFRLTLIAIFVALASPAHATVGSQYDIWPKQAAQQQQRATVTKNKAKRATARAPARTAAVRMASATIRQSGIAQILPHPPGCPYRAFCGCGAALEVFGQHVRNLWLARNWFAFPRAEPAPGMVAVRRHHVFVIKAVLGNGVVMAYDANSGGRKTRLHPRSTAGYVIVNPHGSRRYAAAG